MVQTANLACEHCDLLLTAPTINEQECALCPQCGHKISRLHPQLKHQLLAYGVSALTFLLLASLFSLLRINLGGNITEISLWQSALNLYFGEYKYLSLIVFVVIFLIPAVILLLILSFVILAGINKNIRGLPNMLRLIFGLIPWAMGEVFFVAILVSLVKLVTIAQMEAGWSFWAYLLFCLCYAKVLSLLDRYTMWQWLTSEKSNVKEIEHAI